MGEEQSKTSQNQSQLHVIEQNYANNIMFLAFSTLQSICIKIIGLDYKKQNKRYGQHDKIDYSSKDLNELISQFKSHLFLLRVSKESMEEQFKESKGFVFPKNFSKETALKEISIFRKICKQSGYPILKDFCDDFTKIIEGKYSQLSFQNVDTKVRYTAEEQRKHANNLLKDGINATSMMHDLRNEVEKKGIKNPEDLTTNLNKISVDYEKLGSGQFKPAK